jgi:AsmA protein
VDLKASLTSEGMKFTFSDLRLQLPNYQATGIVSAGWTKRGMPPFFTGTLAFDSFDAGAFVTAFVPSALNLQDMPLKFDTSFLRDFQVDLRLSANKAAFGAVTVAEMAAGVRIVDGHASFAIASGQLANGNLSAEVSVDEDREKGPLCKLLVQARNIDLGTVPGMLGLSGPWPQATGNLEVNLHSRLPLAPSGHTETNGSVKVSGSAGKLVGFDPAVFRELASQKRFFDLSLSAANPLRFDSFQMAAIIDNGIAELNTASFKSTSGNLDLAGVIPYKNNSLAVSGTLGPPAGSTAPATRFFAGGAWPNILISPFSAVISGQ